MSWWTASAGVWTSAPIVQPFRTRKTSARALSMSRRARLAYPGEYTGAGEILAAGPLGEIIAAVDTEAKAESGAGRRLTLGARGRESTRPAPETNQRQLLR